MTVTEAIESLRRFPQCAHLEAIGDRGLSGLCVLAPVSGGSECQTWHYYRLTATDRDLPWLGRWVYEDELPAEEDLPKISTGDYFHHFENRSYVKDGVRVFSLAQATTGVRS